MFNKQNASAFEYIKCQIKDESIINICPISHSLYGTPSSQSNSGSFPGPFFLAETCPTYFS